MARTRSLKYTPGMTIGRFSILERRDGKTHLLCEHGHDKWFVDRYVYGNDDLKCLRCKQEHRQATDPRHRHHFNRLRSRSKQRGYEVTITYEQFVVLRTSPCHYCGDEAGGIDRTDNSIGYTPGNSVPCCTMCNYAKYTHTTSTFLAWAKRLAQHQGFT